MRAIHVVLASDENYRPGLEVTRATMVASCSEPERLVFHVFDETALERLPNVEVFSRYNSSLMPYLRLFLPELLPSCDRVVYSDVDTVWMRDVCELWDRLENPNDPTHAQPSIWWVRDFDESFQKSRPWFERTGAKDLDPDRYACSGVCVMNLRKMRGARLSERAVELVRKFGTSPFPDQNILNLLYNHDSVMLPECWNVIGRWHHSCWRGKCAGADGRAVYHVVGIGRHFHDRVPVDYPSPYDFWNRAAGRWPWNVPMRRLYRMMAAC